MLRAIVIALTLSATTVHAEEYCKDTGGTAPIPEAVIGMEYRHIKPIMVDRGWEAIPQDHSRWVADGAKWFVEAGFTEVADCAGTGAGPCAFMWRDELGNDMQITTVLNYPLSDDGIRHDKVVAMRLICLHNPDLTYVFR